MPSGPWIRALRNRAGCAARRAVGTFFNITLAPRAGPDRRVLLSFIRGVEAFESPLFFGLPAGIDVITTEIYKRSPNIPSRATSSRRR